MTKRRPFSAEQKAEIVTKHVFGQVPISEVCEQYQINVNQFYKWQAEFKSNAAAAFSKPNARKKKAEERETMQLKEQLQKKDEIIAYVTTELMRSKKKNGEI